MVTTKTAVPIVEEALRQEGIQPTPRRVWAVLVTARAESGYGTGWESPPHGPEAPTSKNWGAVQAPGVAPFQYVGKTRPTKTAPASGSSTFFYALDYNPFHVNEDGSNGTWFFGPYKSYPTDLAGARDVVRLLDKKGALEAAESEGTTDAVAQASYGYYTGMTTDKAAQIDKRAAQLQDQADAIANLLGVAPVLVRASSSTSPKAQPPEPTPGEAPPEYCSDLELPTLRTGSQGAAVELWQRLLNSDPRRVVTLTVDGDFGPVTTAATRHWQSRRHLTVDGVVDAISWSRMP